MLQAAPGEWYISVICTKCGNRCLVFHDLSKGKAGLLKSYIAITCPRCKEFGTYPPESYQEPSMSQSSAATAD